MIYAALHALSKPIFKTFFRLTVYGVENIPREGGAIIAPNHQSFLDIPIVGSALPRKMHTLGKKEFIEGKGSWFYKRMGGIPINRNSADLTGLKLAIDTLKQGNLLLMFPEGTRSTNGRVGEIRKGAIFISYKALVPVIPTGIVGTEKALPKDARFPKPVHIVITFGKPIKLWELFNPREASFYDKSAAYIRNEIEKCIEISRERL